MCDVKPERLLERDPYTRLMFEVTRVTLSLIGVRHVVLGDMSRQRQSNLRSISRYKRPNPHLAPEIGRILADPPGTVGGLLMRAKDVYWGREVLMTMLANGICTTDLDQPLHRASPLQWSGLPWDTAA